MNATVLVASVETDFGNLNSESEFFSTKTQWAYPIMPHPNSRECGNKLLSKKEC
jgi:hypothetical protein